jgi:nucleoid DNA-binding protein
MRLEDKNTHLNPKSFKDFFKGVAKDCEVHEDLVSELIRFFYSEVRTSLEDLEYTRIQLPNLGTFILRKGRLDRAIKRHKDMLGNIEKTTYVGYGNHLPIKDKLDKMENALGRVQKEITNKKTWKDENK